MNEQEYEKFCKEAENMRCYDGRGTYDIYKCEDGCGHSMATTYAEKGVTPFVMKCRNCGGNMVHTETFRNKNPVSILYGKIIKFVRPTYKQYCGLSNGKKEHVENGGLILETDL